MPRSSRSPERGIVASAAGPAEALQPEFYRRAAALVARELLGAVIESRVDGVVCRAEIVETEAYTGPDDEASHAHERFGITPRNAVMFGPPGHAYLYRIYGMHWCLNAVTGPPGFPAAVLIRAARPRAGLAAMRQRRPHRADRQLLRGPGNLARALGLDGRLNAHRLRDPPLQILPGVNIPDGAVHVGPRIGVTRAADLPLRFWVAHSPWVSARRSPPHCRRG
jgi:DNA-3-methyladenine glycosylase